MDFLGNLGALGSMGASYPSRFNAPKSSVIDVLPDAQTWMKDWQARYDAEAARRGQGASAGGPSQEEYIRTVLTSTQPSGPVTWQPGKDVDAFTRHLTTGGQLYYGDGQVGEEVARHALGNSLYDQLRNYKPAAPSAGYVPNFTALNAEKNKMTPLFSAQTRQQQAHDSMVGNNQQNGVIGEGYTAPNFGQIDGDFGQSGMGAQANQQNSIDMSWTDGTYNPQGSGGGVYSGPSRRKTEWGLW